MSMKKLILLGAISLFFNTGIAQAGDFAWMEQLSIEAHADASGFKTRLASRFQVGDARISAVIGDVGGRHADAYMVLRLAEMSHQPVDTVLRHYRTSRKRGWGVIARNLGIKPGSREFHALKSGHDLQSSRPTLHGEAFVRGGAAQKGKGNGKGGKGGKDGKDKGKGNKNK